MPIKLFNTLGRELQDFAPLQEGKVGLYSCGPTVYYRASIGNYRHYIFADVLRRFLESQGLAVTHVVNITDVGHLVGDGDVGEDKLEAGAKREGLSAWDVAKKYTDLFVDDLRKLNILLPTVMPKATDHIPEQIALIEALEKNGHTYSTTDGIYFDTATLPDYGKLSGQKLADKEAGARVAVGDKRQPSDFALWKFSPVGEQRQMEWESPWGKGFPGWHIECSAMSAKYLGVPFDIHTSGIDHIAVHHENEIAQTAGALGVLEANYWLHNEFLLVDGGKMGKSLGNAYSLDELVEHGVSPLAYKYLVLGAHYRSPLNFTWEAALAAQNAVAKLRSTLRDLPKPAAQPVASVMKDFSDQLANDLDTPAALATFFGVVNDAAMAGADKAATILAMDESLGLALEDVVARPLVIPEAVQKLVDARALAREAKDFVESDELREVIAGLGFVVEDGPEGQKVREI